MHILARNGVFDVCVTNKPKKEKVTKKETLLWQWVFAQTTHVVGSRSNFACEDVFGR